MRLSDVDSNYTLIEVRVKRLYHLEILVFFKAKILKSYLNKLEKGN